MVTKNTDPEFGKRFDIAHNHSIHRDLTQIEIAKHLKVSQRRILAWRNGTKLPSIKKCRKIALLFEVCVEWLYTGRGPVAAVDHTPVLDLAYRLMALDKVKIDMIKFVIELLEKGTVKDIDIKNALSKLR